MIRKKDEYIKLSKNKLFFMFAGLGLFIIGLALISKPSIQMELSIKPPIPRKVQPTSVPTPTPNITRLGYHGYDEKGNWFDFNLPPECERQDVKVQHGVIKYINCETKDFKIVLRPESSGKGVDVINKDNITLGNYSWRRARYEEVNNMKATAESYSLTLGGDYYVMDAYYYPFTKASQKYAENIIATFHTSNWVRYKTPNYSFSYPSDGKWMLQEGSPVGSSVAVSCRNNCENVSFMGFHISRIASKSPDEYIKNFPGLTDIQDVTIDGLPAIRGISPGNASAGGAAGSRIMYYVNHQGAGYELGLLYGIFDADKYSRFPPLTPDILSTFTFNR
jgi:hypothetical protein